MRCVLVPSATVEIGCDAPPDLGDESPRHTAHLDAFLIDAEPVSTMAYCRFLNSIGTVAASVLSDWFVLDASDQRREHMLIGETVAGWQPTQGAEEWPVILVSWYGANAYSLWANGRDCLNYTDEGIAQSGSSLPSEAQWEYAARGARFQTYPWGDEAPTENRMTYGQHCQGQTYAVDPLPMAKVHESLGMSPFGLHHMAGNVWQWCRDWYDERFYSKSEASLPNPLNNRPTQVRAERGGSWVGPAELCRSSFRRGRPPLARGRCLGFRCISLLEDLDDSGR
jgi:formylglycine-generating enzyme required for sulfatase activity